MRSSGVQIRWLLTAFAVVVPAVSGVTAAAPKETSIVLKADAGGPRFDGIGVVEGGGGTGVLLKDYPEPQRSQILDLLFKPKFGASVSALYVEIPGDGNATQGSMPSHMHTRDDLNAHRGYMWWEMIEARRRNPNLSLDGTAWSAPGWVGTRGSVFPQSTGSAYQGDARFFSQDMADYYLAWLRALRDVHRLSLDAIGMRNEKGASYDFAKAMRRTLDAGGFESVRLHGFDNWPNPWKFDFVRDMEADPALRDTIDIVGAHINAPQSAVSGDVQTAAKRMGKPIWNTEQHVYKPGFDALIGIVQAFNDNYVRGGVTKIVNWYGIAGLYTTEPYSGEEQAAVRANWPWSGHYSINPALWGYAHYGQFSAIGWQYLAGGSGALSGGGSFVTLKSPGDDYSVVIETKDAAGPQQLRLSAGPGLSRRALAVWRSDRARQFVRQPDLDIRDGVATIELAPDSVYSLTSTRGQQKGAFAGVPARAPFPFPYRETFDGYARPARWGYLPRYFADIAGAFELDACPGRPGLCLHQAAPVPTISWAPDWKPYTILGDDQWRDYQISADVRIAPGEAAAVMGRIANVGTGYGFIPKGYYLQLAADGEVRLVVSRGKVDKKALVGDAEQQALIRKSADATEGGEKLLATTRVPGMVPSRWHRLQLRFRGTTITGLVDGKPVLSVEDTLYPSGMAGLLAAPVNGRLSQPWFDTVTIDAGPGGAAAATSSGSGRASVPIYRDAR